MSEPIRVIADDGKVDEVLRVLGPIAKSEPTRTKEGAKEGQTWIIFPAVADLGVFSREAVALKVHSVGYARLTPHG